MAPRTTEASPAVASAGSSPGGATISTCRYDPGWEMAKTPLHVATTTPACAGLGAATDAVSTGENVSSLLSTADSSTSQMTMEPSALPDARVWQVAPQLQLARAVGASARSDCGKCGNVRRRAPERGHCEPVAVQPPDGLHGDGVNYVDLAVGAAQGDVPARRIIRAHGEVGERQRPARDLRELPFEPCCAKCVCV